jgi:hypothetical protein
MAVGTARLAPDAINATAFLFLGSEMMPSATSPWTLKLDSRGNPHHCIHRDGHRVALFDEGWWAYHADYRYAPPGRPRVGPDPVGPFATLRLAQRFVEAQGFTSVFPFDLTSQSPAAVPA